jgi:uncharacterized membrane protein YeaQ/YmgE (transglycosylase-associated protein family)
MDVRNIETMVLTHTDDIEKELRGDILAKAYQEFGYQADSFDAFGPLAKAFVKCDIAPLNTEQVEKYKASKESNLTIKTWPFYILTLLSVVGVYWGFAYHYIRNTNNDSGMVAVIIVGAVGTIVALICGAIFSDEMPTYKRSRGWHRYNLDKYEDRTFHQYPRYVPVHILNMAVQLKNELSGAKFYIDELTTLTVAQWPEPDPFILVQYGSEKYYFGVWDEREFEAKA